jgi:Uma2 family endonuclease
MMSVPTAYPRTTLITGEALWQMGDIGPCELVEGEIVPMSPANVEHAFLEAEIGRLLGNFVAERQLGWVLVGEVGIYTRYNPDSVRAADVAFISKERIPQRLRQGFLKVAPELVIEVVSPGDGWLELHDKTVLFYPW